MSDKTIPRIHYEEDYYYININVPKPVPKPNYIIIKNDKPDSILYEENVW